MDSMSEADYVVVLDTGSTDDTVERLRARGAYVEIKPIKPWRFDVARNESIKLIPKDVTVCVCTDLDEVFEKGWADVLRESWKPTTQKAKYLYSWNHDTKGNPLIQIWYEKIHANNEDWFWAMPVHEALTHKSRMPVETIYLPAEKFHLHHYPDLTKSRGQYLDLMKLGISENPNDFMQQWYYGRELYYHKKYKEAVEQLKFVQTMPYIGFHYQKSASLVFLGHAYKELKQYDKAELAYIEAAQLVNDVREPILFLTHLYYELGRGHACIDAGEKALQINYVKGAWYEDSTNYREKPHDYLSIAYYNIENYKLALEHIHKALEYNPTNERFVKNKEFILEKTI